MEMDMFCSLPRKTSSTHSVRQWGWCGQDPAFQLTAGSMRAARRSVTGVREGACWASPAHSSHTGTFGFPTSLKETNVKLIRLYHHNMCERTYRYVFMQVFMHGVMIVKCTNKKIIFCMNKIKINSDLCTIILYLLTISDVLFQIQEWFLKSLMIIWMFWMSDGYLEVCVVCLFSLTVDSCPAGQRAHTHPSSWRHCPASVPHISNSYRETQITQIIMKIKKELGKWWI